MAQLQDLSYWLRLAVHATVPRDGAETSAKQWTARYRRDEWNWTLHECTLKSFLCGGFDNDADRTRLGARYFFQPIYGKVFSEAEVQSHFDKCFWPVCNALRGPKQELSFRYGMGPLGETTFGQTVDLSINFEDRNRSLVLGEFKKPGVISYRDWTKSRGFTPASKRLAQELVGYCHMYKSRSIFCWDGIWLLMLHFYGEDSVKTTDPQVWLVHAAYCASSNGPDIIAAREALYLLIRAAWQQYIYRRQPFDFNGYSLQRNAVGYPVSWVRYLGKDKAGVSLWDKPVADHPGLTKELRGGNWVWTDDEEEDQRRDVRLVEPTFSMT